MKWGDLPVGTRVKFQSQDFFWEVTDHDVDPLTGSPIAIGRGPGGVQLRSLGDSEFGYTWTYASDTVGGVRGNEGGPVVTRFIIQNPLIEEDPLP